MGIHRLISLEHLGFTKRKERKRKKKKGRNDAREGREEGSFDSKYIVFPACHKYSLRQRSILSDHLLETGGKENREKRRKQVSVVGRNRAEFNSRSGA